MALAEAFASIHYKLLANRRASRLAQEISTLFPKGATVLDVGSGDGLLASLWQAERPDISVTGLDVMVRPDTRIPVRSFDGSALPYDDNSTDVVTFIDVLHHTDNVERLLAEAARVARSWVIVKDHFSENTIDHATLTFMDWVGNAAHGVECPNNYLSRQQWSEVATKAGLQLASRTTQLRLYPRPLDWIFGRDLHFAAKFRAAN